MLNLILKDIYMQKNALFILLPALIIYLLIGTSAVWICIVFCIVIITDSFAKDEKTPSNLLLNALPYTRKEIVSSKYISALAFIFLVLLTIFLGNWLMHGEFIQLDQLLLITGIVIVSISFIFPFSYLFKSQYLMRAFIIGFIAYMVIINLFIPNLNDRIRNFVQTVLSFDNSQVYFIILLSVVLFYILSFLLSIRIYSRKVF
ncbi:ABC-2 transporter permease [Gracilibacillus oryzae]|uniref:ABC-2 transporter permease n=1 Tax=Gracilibacillus oryzae TaxID=1672701 RepID=A0A7C8KS93_9BACI|nr:ABC-2 transporter permease [Gracilibacillus oryzae]KAB8126253.1 ABC-2 transporter permease [Gracilibacillus oryzae]